jgi:hypothetical protein
MLLSGAHHKEGFMYARVASFEGGDIDRLQEQTEARRASGELALPEGVKRALVLADRDANRRQFITFFDSKEALDAAEQRFEAMGDEIPEDVRGRRTSVATYEVVFDEET